MNNAPERIWISSNDESILHFTSAYGDKHLDSDIEYIREDVIGYGFVAQATAFILGIMVGMVIVQL